MALCHGQPEKLNRYPRFQRPRGNPMIRTILFSLTVATGALLAFAAPDKAAAQDGRYPPPPRAQDIGGTWFMSGHEDEPCQILPSRNKDRAMFTNENGDRAEGFIRGNVVTVPRWNITARIDGDVIRWSNRSVWTR
jgi:hypothetical protein